MHTITANLLANTESAWSVEIDISCFDLLSLMGLKMGSKQFQTQT
jgi:hypothetical protein